MTTGSTVRRRLAVPTALGLTLAMLCGAVPAAGTTGDDDRSAPWAGAADPTGGPRSDDRGPFGASAGVDGADAGEDDGHGPLLAAESEPAPEPVPGRVLVEFEPGTSPAERAAALAPVGAAVIEEVPGTDVLVVDIGDEDPAEAAAHLAEADGVVVAQPDHVRSAAVWPDDPGIDVTWPYLDLVRLPRAWDETIGQGVVVAVLDTGVYAAHEDLTGRVLRGRDLVNGDDDAADDDGHGTVVAGVLAATGNNGVGNVGAAPGATILPVKVLDADGNGSDSVVAAGIAYAVIAGADVVNLSLSGTDQSPVLLRAIESAVAAGVVVVAAAGNDPSGATQYPAAYAPEVPGLLSVSATDDDGALADFSSWADSVTLSAPGVDLVGPGISGSASYVAASGTSVAAPLVSGAAALVRAQQPGLTPAQVEERLVTATRDAGPRGVDPYYGRGVLDVAAALGAIPAVPLDRRQDDGGADHHPADAVPMVATRDRPAQATGVLEREGDADWYVYEPTSPGSYVVSVDPLGHPVRLEVRDAKGDVVAAVSQPYGGPPSSVAFEGYGPWWIQVTGAAATREEREYTVTVVPAEEALGGPWLLSPPRALSSVTSGPISAFSDVTGDGMPDVVIRTTTVVEGADASSSAPVVGFYPATSATEFGALRSVRLGDQVSHAPVVTAADLDGDGVAEIVAHDGSSESSATGVIDGRTVPISARRVAEGAPPAGPLLPVDLDQDGDEEVLMSTTSGVAVFDGPDLRLTKAPGWSVDSAPDIAVLDVDGDGDDDVVGAGTGALLQGADWSFTSGGMPEVLTGARRVEAADVTGDGRDDLIVETGGALLMSEAHEAGGFGPGVELARPYGIDQMTVTDVDGDGQLDVVTNERSWLVARILRKGGATVRMGWYASTSGDPVYKHLPSPFGDVVFVDRDDDGDQDLLYMAARGGLVERMQLEPPVTEREPGWVWDSSINPHTTGLAMRPTVALTFLNPLLPTSITASTVRLVDGLTGLDVPLVRGYTGGEVTATPSVELIPGRHYTLLVSGLVDSTGAVMSEPYRTWFTVGADGDRFTPMEPYRLMDTRWDDWRVEPGEPITLDLSRNVPRGVTAVVLNVASTQADHVGNVRVYPSESEQVPRVANLNVVPGVDQSNLVTVALGEERAVDLLAEGMSTHLVVDIAGYYIRGGATGFVPMAPKRMLDMRDGTGGVPPGRLGAGRFVDIQVTGRNGVPADATAVVFNLAATGVTGRTHVRAYPTPAASEDQTPPDIANLNVDRGRDQANLVTVRVGEGGKVRLYTHSAALFLVADVAGYYSPTGDHGFVPVAPQRIADSRIGLGFPQGHLRAGTATQLTVAGGGVVPADAATAVLNVAATQVRGQTHVRAFPTTVPATLPDVSTLNLVPGRDESNHAFVRVGDRGRVTFYPWSSDVQLVVDVFGYFRR